MRVSDVLAVVNHVTVGVDGKMVFQFRNRLLFTG